MDLDELMKSFRLADRELFNNFFHVSDPWNDTNTAWDAESRFGVVQGVLFQQLVLEAADIPLIPYKKVQPSIHVELGSMDTAPAMINRDINSGYWDYPLKQITREPVMLFLNFFDWDQLSYRDNRYVHAKIESWPSRNDAAGKHVLVDSHYVRFTLHLNAAISP